MNSTLPKSFRNTVAIISVFALCLAGACAMTLPNADAAVKKPAKVKVASVKSAKAGQITIKVKKAKGAKGYQYWASTSKKFDKGARYDMESLKSKKKTVTFSGLKEGRTYYVKVRAYAGKKYGKWSGMKSVKMKSAVNPLQADLDGLSAELEALKAEKTKLKTDLETMRSDNARLRAEVERLGGDPGPAEPQVGDGTRTNPFLATTDVTLANHDGTVAFRTVNTWRDAVAISKLEEFGAYESEYTSAAAMRRSLEDKSLALIEYNATIKSGYDDNGFSVWNLMPSFGTVLNTDATTNIEYSEVSAYSFHQTEGFRLINDSSWTIYGAGTSAHGYLVAWLPKGTSAFVVKQGMGTSKDIWIKYII